VGRTVVGWDRSIGSGGLGSGEGGNLEGGLGGDIGGGGIGVGSDCGLGSGEGCMCDDRLACGGL